MAFVSDAQQLIREGVPGGWSFLTLNGAFVWREVRFDMAVLTVRKFFTCTNHVRHRFRANARDFICSESRYYLLRLRWTRRTTGSARCLTIRPLRN